MDRAATPAGTRAALPTPVLVLDGYGVQLTVSRGRLVLRDGMGQHRRLRELSRIERTVRRIVILGDTGTISLAAVRWCADVGIAVVQIDRDGRALLHAGATGKDDARLRRAQAAAPGNPVGLEITRGLLEAKLAGQAAVAAETLAAPRVSDRIIDLLGQLGEATGLAQCRDLEAQAGNVYFGAWAGAVRCVFAEREQDKVPGHWADFAVRRSPVQGSATPRSAATPINAMLNYGYTLAAVECRLAAIMMGLDPGMGIVHTDKRDRDSLALDLLEPLRPLVDRFVLSLLGARHFQAGDFHETRQGVCRVLDPINHLLCEQLPAYAAAVGPLAEQLTHALAVSSPGKIYLSTPLSRANVIRAQSRGRCSANRTEPPAAGGRPTCQKCGTQLYGQARKLCPTCWPVSRNAYISQLAKSRANPPGPAKPTAQELSGGCSYEQYQTVILPALAAVSLIDLEKATGLSNGSCCRVRQGKQLPNPRHWAALAAAAGVSKAVASFEPAP